MKCDELKDYDYDPDFPFQSRGRFYVADEVEAAIDELKSEHHKERHEYIKMIAELNAEINRKENVGKRWFKRCMEERAENVKLKRALWLARAYRAEARKNYWYARSVHEGDELLWSIDGSAVKYIGCIKRTNFDWLKTWSEVEIKCRAMAEKFGG